MPYIKREDARDLNHGVRTAATPGELNYQISQLLATYIEDNGLSYQTLNDVSGAATEALAEFRRRIVVVYEDLKRQIGVDPYFHVHPHVVERPQTWINRVNNS